MSSASSDVNVSGARKVKEEEKGELTGSHACVCGVGGGGQLFRTIFSRCLHVVIPLHVVTPGQ